MNPAAVESDSRQSSKSPRSDGTAKPSLNESIGEATWAERRRALRALLKYPLLIEGESSREFSLVRRHAVWLREWFAHHAGWGLTVDGEMARLRKITTDSPEDMRPARDAKTEVPFSRRRYVVLCLALAVLETEDRQTTLGQLAKRIESSYLADPQLAAAGIAFDLNNADARRDLVQVIRFLLGLSILRRQHGNEDQFISRTGDVLYNIGRPTLAAMLCVKRGPSTVAAGAIDDRIGAITEELLPPTDEGRNRGLRTRLIRRLLDDPIVYYDDLEVAEYDYLNSQRSRLLQQIEIATGLIPEIRREGIAMLDPGGDLSDIGLPEEGTDGHMTLLVAQYLADQLRSSPRLVVGEATLSRYVAELIEQHKHHWRKDVCQAGAAEALSRQTVERLEALRLVNRVAGGIRPLAAIARYGLAEVTLSRPEDPPGAARA